MSEDESRRATQEEEVDEVEAHRRAAANEEAGDETDADGDDVEGHMRKGAPSEEGGRAL
jgi:hypothetical protein